MTFYEYYKALHGFAATVVILVGDDSCLAYLNPKLHLDNI